MKRYVVISLLFIAAHALPQVAVQESRVPVESRRSVEQTFLTFPEWFLVHSPAEYAHYVKEKPPHGFPFLGHIGQLWRDYAHVTDEQIRAGYPANVGYHVMIVVLATSTTIEYSLRWVYENTLGRLSWASSSGRLTPEDRYSAEVAQDYVDFIRHEPWYLYNFRLKLVGLWTENPSIGRDMLRKWERRYALTTEYTVKMAYAWLIEKATRTAYEPALMTTVVETDRVPAHIPSGLNIEVLRKFDDGTALMSLPRYFDFKEAAARLAEEGVSIVDVAGNRSVIFLTVWTVQNKEVAPRTARTLFEEPLLTVPGMKRVGLVLPVRDLSSFLLQAKKQGLAIEHVHDY